jgi:hypothetical protein
MGQNRIMPSKKQIFNYWFDKIIDLEDLELNDCWGCGFPASIQRCHIQDRCESKNDSVENLVLLCKSCHRMQEVMCKTEQGRSIFLSKLIQGSIFFEIRFKELKNIYDIGIYNHLNLH